MYTKYQVLIMVGEWPLSKCYSIMYILLLEYYLCILTCKRFNVIKYLVEVQVTVTT